MYALRTKCVACIWLSGNFLSLVLVYIKLLCVTLSIMGIKSDEDILNRVVYFPVLSRTTPGHECLYYTPGTEAGEVAGEARRDVLCVCSSHGTRRPPKSLCLCYCTTHVLKTLVLKPAYLQKAGSECVGHCPFTCFSLKNRLLNLFPKNQGFSSELNVAARITFGQL